jgi:2-polyprenyl-3-methyl-5-hydroxy-6-metoxy-1,4-benzoquinol methylase
MLKYCRVSIIFSRRFSSLSNPLAFSTCHTDSDTGRNPVLTGTLNLTEAPPLSKRKAKKQRQLLLKMQIYPAQGDTVSEFMRAKYEKEARKYWDLFYKRNADRFFKDRHYLQKEWGHLLRNTALPPILGSIDSGRTLEISSVENEQPGTTSIKEAVRQDQAGEALSSPDTGAPTSLNGVNEAMQNERLSNGVSPLAAKTVLLEVGCGAGNTVYPLLEENPAAFVYACDFSPRAVDLVKVSKRTALSTSN